MGSPTAPSSHALGKRVHAMLVGAILTDLLGGCGPSGQPPVGWQYGGGEQPVLSWPVVDRDGNLFVLVGSEAREAPPGYGDAVEVDAVDLVSLDALGGERWAVELAGAIISSREVSVRPIVGPAGDIWVHLDEEVMRVSARGEVLWRLPSVPDPDGYGSEQRTSLQAALGSSGTYYALPRIEVGTTFEKQQLRAIGPNGTELWSLDPGEQGQSGADFNPVPTQTEAPLVDAEGRVIAGCDTCVADRVGLARFDEQSGQATMFFSVAGSPPSSYRLVLSDGETEWLNLSGADEGADNGLWTVAASGATTRPERGVALSASSGAVWTNPEYTSDPGFLLYWGDDAIEITPSEAVLGGEFRGVRPIAVVEPQSVLLEVFVRIPSTTGGSSTSAQGLLLVDGAGAVVWHAGGMFRDREPVPAIGDGFIAYIEADTQRLVAVEAPVERVADGPWPIIGGDPQGTRSAEQK